MKLPRPLLAAVLCLLPALGLPRTPARGMEVGMNVSAPAYWANDWPFVDLLRSGSDWRVATEQDAWLRVYESEHLRDGRVALTPGGFPYVPGEDWESGQGGIRAFRVLVPGGNEAAVEPGSPGFFESPVGDYTFLGEGTGRVRISGGGFTPTTIEFNGTGTEVTVRREAGQETEDPRQFGLIEIEATDAADPVRGLRLVMPGHAESFEEHPFHPLFLERLRPFAGVRLMDWNNVNQSAVASWEERPTVEFFSWANAARQVRTDDPAFADRRGLLPGWGEPGAVQLGGVPLEVQAQLAVELDCDLWVCLPALADADYARRATRLLRDRMPAGRELVVEWGNEVWNRAFLPDRLARAAVGGDRQALNRHLTDRISAAYAAVRGEFGPEEGVSLVIPYQLADAYMSREDAPRVDAAISHFYWGIDWVKRSFDEGWHNESDAELLDRMDAQVMEDLREDLTEQRAEIARVSEAYYPVGAWAYEGGSHFHAIWWRKDIQEATGGMTSRLQHHPRMEGLYHEMFGVLRETGFDEKNHLFANTGRGFGHLQHPTQDPADAPKFRAAVAQAGR